MNQPLKGFLARLSDAEHVPRLESEAWTAMIERISVPGRIADIDEEVFFYFLEVLPPKFQGAGHFAFAEAAEPLRLFWVRRGEHFCRQLTWEETKTFCELADIPLPT
jgi:hypothetical protein